MRRLVAFPLVLLGALAPPAAIRASPSGADQPKEPRTETVVKRWRQQGAKGMPDMVRAYCSSQGDYRLANAAQAELRRSGLAAVFPLLSYQHSWCSPEHFIAELLCQTRPVDQPALDELLLRLSPLLRAPRREPHGDTSSRLWWALAKIYPSEGSQASLDCPNRQILSEGVLRVLLRVPEAEKISPSFAAEFAQILPALLAGASTPRASAAYVPLLIRFAEKEGTGRIRVFIRALEFFGEEAAPAVPLLRRLLGGELEAIEKARASKEWAAMSGGTNVTAIARTAAAIGRAASALAPDLIKAFERQSAHACRWEESEDSGALLKALGSLDRSTWKSIAPTVERAWKALGACQDHLAHLSAGDVGRGRLLDGIAAFGAHAASFAPLAIPLLTDRRHGLPLRGQAARALLRIGAPLHAQEAAWARVLSARLGRQERDATVRRPGPAPKPTESDAASAAMNALFDCQDDAGMARSKVTVAALMSFSYDEHHRFRGCISNRLCGPGEDHFAETMETCCAYAYARTSPSFCSAGAKFR